MTPGKAHPAGTPDIEGAIPLLIIDDDTKFCRLIRDYLEPMGYAVEMAHSGPEGLQLALTGTFEAILLDVMLPGMDGFEVLQRLRQASQVPVLMLTARGDEMDRIVGLEIGADDYLPKTFSTRELLARLRAVIRRVGGSGKSGRASESNLECVVGSLRLHPGARQAWLDERPLALTPVEYDLLLSLARAAGRI